MNLPAELRAHDPRQSLSTVTHIMYALHIASVFSAGIFSVVAIIINYVKRDSLPDDFFRSHFRWQARSFWFTLLWLVLTLPLWIAFIPGWVAWVVIGLWYLYRFVRGWLAFAEGRPMPMPHLPPAPPA
jgi:uncharacterized membrane protein